MREHHKRIIDKLIKKYRNDNLFQALIVGGSIAKGTDTENSDVDIILVATDEEFNRRKKSKDYHFFDFEISDYPGVYVDAKIVNLQYLIDASERGSEPARAGFIGAFVAYSKIQGIDDVVRCIPVYQEHEQEKKLEAFYSQLYPLRFFVNEAIEKNNRYLLLRMVPDIILFGGRIILAQNKILFPSQKGFMKELEKAEIKPVGIIQIMNQLMDKPSIENIDLFIDKIFNYDAWNIKPKTSVGIFMENNDWSWIKGRVSISDW